MTDPNCDCGACCTQCGHDRGCMSREVPESTQDDTNNDAYNLG